MKVEQRPKIECECVIRLTEAEMRALDAIVGYGWKSFIEVFKKHLGTHYIREHEEGGKLFFETVREFIPHILRRTDDARMVFTGEKEARRPDATPAVPSTQRDGAAK